MKKELQEKVVAYRILEAKLEGLLKQRDMIVSKMLELQTTLMGIEEFEKSDEGVLFHIGSETYVFGRIVNKEKMIIGIGAGIALEKTSEEAKEIINKRNKELKNILNNIEREIMQVSSNLEVLGPEISKLSKKIEESKAG